MGEQIKGKMEIPKITHWMESVHSELNYYATQFLTVHKYFTKYLHRFGHDNSPTFPKCIDEDMLHQI